MAEYKDITPLKKQISDVKKAINSPNSDYMTGYICALSVTEGIIAELPTADVVEVVRCEKCKHGEVSIMSKAKDGEEDIACYCNLKKKVTDIDWYCPNGERRDT